MKDDIPFYPDVGCKRATAFLGGVQSHCLTCPYLDDCVEQQDGIAYRKSHLQERNEQIRAEFTGRNCRELAKKFDLAYSTIKKVVRGRKGGAECRG